MVKRQHSTYCSALSVYNSHPLLARYMYMCGTFAIFEAIVETALTTSPRLQW